MNIIRVITLLTLILRFFSFPGCSGFPSDDATECPTPVMCGRKIANKTAGIHIHHLFSQINRSTGIDSNDNAHKERNSGTPS